MLTTVPHPIKLSRNEGLKTADPLLAGSIAQTLTDPAADHFNEDDYEFLKFHGVYQQDDRDQRKMAKHYMLMVRTKFPGGVLSAEQYLACDELASHVREQHPADHDAAGFSISWHPQIESAADRSKR